MRRPGRDVSDGANRRKVIRKVVGGSAAIVADATQENLLGVPLSRAFPFDGEREREKERRLGRGLSWKKQRDRDIFDCGPLI